MYSFVFFTITNRTFCFLGDNFFLISTYSRPWFACECAGLLQEGAISFSSSPEYEEDDGDLDSESAAEAASELLLRGRILDQAQRFLLTLAVHDPSRRAKCAEEASKHGLALGNERRQWLFDAVTASATTTGATSGALGSDIVDSVSRVTLEGGSANNGINSRNSDDLDDDGDFNQDHRDVDGNVRDIHSRKQTGASVVSLADPDDALRPSLSSPKGSSSSPSLRSSAAAPAAEIPTIFTKAEQGLIVDETAVEQVVEGSPNLDRDRYPQKWRPSSAALMAGGERLFEEVWEAAPVGYFQRAHGRVDGMSVGKGEEGKEKEEEETLDWVFDIKEAARVLEGKNTDLVLLEVVMVMLKEQVSAKLNKAEKKS